MAPIRPSQEVIDEFWKTFITPSVAPSKASAILPRNVYDELIKEQQPRSVTLSESVDASYEAARKDCEAKVAQIVRECTQINQKYSDPYFNLEDQSGCLRPLSVPEEPTRPPAPGQSFDIVQGNNQTGRLVLYGEEDLEGAEKETNPVPKSVKRVGDIFDNPRFFVDGADAKDIRQGYEGDCWFLSALAALCNIEEKQKLIDRVCVARDQDVGVYGFCLYRDGDWTSVIIDDKLYLRFQDYEDSDEQNRAAWENNRVRINSAEDYRKEFQSNSRALFYAQSTDPDETWVPLLEKAFAKAHGDYESIAYGYVSEGVEDLTGGVSDMIVSADILSKDKFWTDSLLKVNKEYLFGCGTPSWDDPFSLGRDGIQGGHAYSVLRAVEYKGERLVLLKNPWGQSEWNGPWSDGSKEWTADSIKDLDHSFGDDGIFWIPYKDLLRKYDTIYRTRLFSSEWNVAQQWTNVAVPWAGEYQELKFEVVINKSAPTVIVLSQLDDRYFRGLTGQYTFKLSFRVHKKDKEEYLVRTFGEDFGQRSVHSELFLDAGTYEVKLKISGLRNENAPKIEDVVKANWLDNREKLIRIGLAYDVAHAKTRANETLAIAETTEKPRPKPKSGKTTKTTKTTTITRTTTLTKEHSEALEKGEAPPEDGPKGRVPSGEAPGQGEGPGEGVEAADGEAADNIQVTVDDPVIGADDDDFKDKSNNGDKEDDEEAEKAWAAVAVVGLRVYCKDADASVSITRPKQLVPQLKLDVDDPAKDASVVNSPATPATAATAVGATV